MNIVICGGGKIGQNLAQVMLEKKHDVHLIEKDREKCYRLANTLNAEILCADCSSMSALEAVKTRKCDCFMALTGVDQDNLVAAQLARDYFQAKKVIARVNDPRNTETFHRLGINLTVSSTEIITELIEQEADLAQNRLVATLGSGSIQIVESVLPANSLYDGKKLKEIKLPKGMIMISVSHNGELTIPNGDTVVRSGDEVVAVCLKKSVREYTKLITLKSRFR